TWTPDLVLMSRYFSHFLRISVKEQSPYDMETIANEQKIPSLLSGRGYSDDDIQNIMYGNWLRFLRKVWKPGV
ncbi:MAG: membrane dipeptidase, partial [Bacteroidia bacterium]|nr:membrane dipeptidase [Bacteroidia bacterium]